MAKPIGQLKRISHEGHHEAVMLSGGQINFRHYHITVHALDRFVERTGMTADWIVPTLSEAFIAYQDRTTFRKVQAFIAKAEERKGYVLMHPKGIYFAIEPDEKSKSHVVKTVFAYENFHRRAS